MRLCARPDRSDERFFRILEGREPSRVGTPPPARRFRVLLRPPPGRGRAAAGDRRSRAGPGVRAGGTQRFGSGRGRRAPRAGRPAAASAAGTRVRAVRPGSSAPPRLRGQRSFAGAPAFGDRKHGTGSDGGRRPRNHLRGRRPLRRRLDRARSRHPPRGVQGEYSRCRPGRSARDRRGRPQGADAGRLPGRGGGRQRPGRRGGPRDISPPADLTERSGNGALR